MGYNVAFRKTKINGVLAGLVTWTTFETKEQFNSMWKKEEHFAEEVIDEGITDKKCVELVVQSYIHSIIARL